MAQEHKHERLVHAHEHLHVTHYDRPGEEWTHLTSTHGHDHDHPALSHTHEPHKNMEKEHAREAHVHDHAHPANSARSR
jgi:hypothetical protein